MKNEKVSVTRPGFLRPPDAAKYLGVSLRCVRDWQQRRIIPYSKMGKRCVLFRMADLESVVMRNRVDCIGGME